MGITPTRWESSKRPLFIKTIWRDGHHHVILDRSEEPAETPKRTTPRPSSKASRLVKSAPNNATALNVSSTKLLGEAGKVEAPKPSSLRRCNTSVRFAERRPQKVDKPSANKLNLSIKSSSIDLNGSKDHITVEKTFPFLSFDIFDAYNESLSDRVMIWLDLATQNGILDRPITARPRDPPEKTPSSLQRNLQMKRKISYQMFEPPGGRCFQVEGIAQKSPVSSFDSASTPVSDGKFDGEAKKDVHEDVLLSSEVEESFVLENISSDDLRSVNFAKRQLHIFIPRLQKKLSDCDSVLSSNLSNYSGRQVA